jgi:hypothetical protein
VCNFKLDEDRSRIVFWEPLERKAEVILSFEGRMIEALEDMESDSEEGDASEEGES